MKHIKTIKEILNSLHDDWMDDDDKQMFYAEMIVMFGVRLNNDIDEGIQKVVPVEKQKELAINMIKSMKIR